MLNSIADLACGLFGAVRLRLQSRRRRRSAVCCSGGPLSRWLSSNDRLSLRRRRNGSWFGWCQQTTTGRRISGEARSWSQGGGKARFASNVYSQAW